MNINSQQIVSISEANQNFSRVAKMAEKAARWLYSRTTSPNTDSLTSKAILR